MKARICRSIAASCRSRRSSSVAGPGGGAAGATSVDGLPAEAAGFRPAPPRLPRRLRAGAALDTLPDDAPSAGSSAFFAAAAGALEPVFRRPLPDGLATDASESLLVGSSAAARGLLPLLRRRLAGCAGVDAAGPFVLDSVAETPEPLLPLRLRPEEPAGLDALGSFVFSSSSDFACFEAVLRRKNRSVMNYSTPAVANCSVLQRAATCSATRMKA